MSVGPAEQKNKRFYKHEVENPAESQSLKGSNCHNLVHLSDRTIQDPSERTWAVNICSKLSVWDPSRFDSLRCKLLRKMKNERPRNTDYPPRVSFLQKDLNLRVELCGNLQNSWKRYKKRYSIRSVFSLIDRSLSQSHFGKLGACLISASPRVELKIFVLD